MRRLDELPPEVPGELHAEDSRGVALAGAKADLTAVILLRTCFLWPKLNPRVSWPPSFWALAFWPQLLASNPSFSMPALRSRPVNLDVGWLAAR